MRQGPNTRRSRGRGNANGSGGGGGGGGSSSSSSSGNGRRQNVPLRHQTFDSNGPDVRIRGNAFQVHEKYLALARDATASGDRVAAENFLQHAEHYFRIINQINEVNGDGQRGRHPRDGNGHAYPGQSDDDMDQHDDDHGAMADGPPPLNA